MPTKLTTTLVAELVAKYDSEELSNLERYIFENLSQQINRQGFASQDQFLAICNWKTTRTKSLVRTNSPDDIMEITGLAFSSSDHLRVRILTLLKGVAVPTASAILSVWDPNRYTVYDFRVLSAIKNLDHNLLKSISNRTMKFGYSDYLDLARVIAVDLEVSLRDLDKCLWMFDKYLNK